MTEIIMTRHGETQWNIQEIFRGRLDVELNEKGLKQADLLGKYLADSDIDAVYTSPMKRAIQTAEAVARYHKQHVRIAREITDLDFGNWQGLTLAQVKEQYKELYLVWQEQPDKTVIPGGETLGDVRRRSLSFVHELVNRHSGTFMLVTHRVIVKVLTCALLGLGDSHFWNIRVDSCGITAFSYRDGQYILNEHNSTSFLRGLDEEKLRDF
jgi:broad specificity phosphatase PhoE